MNQKTPYEIAMSVLETQYEPDSDPDKDGESLAVAVQAAIRVAIVSERQRCLSICDRMIDQQQFEVEGRPDSDITTTYIHGYKDGAEDCKVEMCKIDAVELAHHDAAIARMEEKAKAQPDLQVVADPEPPSDLLIDILREDEEEVVWVE